MAAPKVRVIIIGGGNWAATAHIPAVQGHPDAEAVGLFRRDAVAARKMADDFSIPHASADLPALIRESKPDAAIVSSIAATVRIVPSIVHASPRATIWRGQRCPASAPA